MPLGQSCVACRNAALFRCQYCGPCGFYCWECFEAYHKQVNLFHVVEKWENDHFVAVERTIDHPDVRARRHQCSSTKKVLIECIDEYGTQHKLNFMCCNCESLAVTLTRAKLWPATSLNPRFVFTFPLLEWAEALMLECQVSLRDFTNALKFRNPFSIFKGREFYSVLINSFEEFRYMKHQLRHMNFCDENLDLGNKCPACPQNHDGKFVLAMDALFGLPRKKAAGVSYRSPLHGDLFYLDQSLVDQYVRDSQKPKNLSTECNDFLAGSMIRSASRYKSLDETAVFGYCCRHEFPGKFINLKHGEKLAYAVFMLEHIISQHSTEQSQLFVMYDIACTLSKHLKSQNRKDILDSTHLCLPAFHCYGHKVSCQVVYGPRRCVGIGLSDGETMERLWSFLRRFALMTKEMRPSHRIDVLTSALVYYGIKTKDKLASLLHSRYERAIKTKQIAEEMLDEVLTQSNITYDDIEKWLADEVASCQFSPQRTNPVPWQAKYFHILQVYYSLKNQLISGGNGLTIIGQLFWLEHELCEYEHKHSISRWLPSDIQYKELEYSLLLNKKEQLLLEVWRVSKRRLFLLRLKKKYAEGQKIAKKLSSQISKESSLIRSLLEDYNACHPHAEPPDELTLAEAMDPSTIGGRLQSLGTWPGMMSGERREVMDAYLTLCRCQEDLVMLNEEAKNTVHYYEDRKGALELGIEQASVHSSDYNRGITARLHQMLARTLILLEQSRHLVEAMQHNDCSDEHSDWSDIEENSDSDDCIFWNNS